MAQSLQEEFLKLTGAILVKTNMVCIMVANQFSCANALKHTSDLFYALLCSHFIMCY